MKKALLYGLSVTMLLASLTACGTSQADQPDPTPTPSAVQTQPVETPEPEETKPPVEPMAITLRKPTQEELFDYFQIVYEMGQVGTNLGSDDDSMLERELKELYIFFNIDPEFEKPTDLDAQYLAWREANYPKEPATEAPSNNPQTQPSTNNQAQPVGNQTGGNGGGTTQTNTGTQQTGPTIVDDYGNPVSGGGTDRSLETGGQRVDWSQVKTLEEKGITPVDPSQIDYGGN